MLDHHKSVEAHEILVLLLRLRQMCCHPALIHTMLDKQDAEVNGIEEPDINNDLLNKLQNMSITEGEEGEVAEHVANYKIDERVAENLLTKKNPVFNNNRRGSKVYIHLYCFTNFRKVYESRTQSASDSRTEILPPSPLPLETESYQLGCFYCVCVYMVGPLELKFSYGSQTQTFQFDSVSKGIH